MLDRVKGTEALPSVGGVGGLQDVMEPMSHLITAGGLERHANISHTHTHTRTCTHPGYSIKKLHIYPLTSPQSPVCPDRTPNIMISLTSGLYFAE